MKREVRCPTVLCLFLKQPSRLGLLNIKYASERLYNALSFAVSGKSFSGGDFDEYHSKMNENTLHQVAS